MQMCFNASCFQVTFQVCIDSVTKRKRATNIACKRNQLRGRIESIKGQVCETDFFFFVKKCLGDTELDLTALGIDVTVLIVNHEDA